MSAGFFVILFSSCVILSFSGIAGAIPGIREFFSSGRSGPLPVPVKEGTGETGRIGINREIRGWSHDAAIGFLAAPRWRAIAAHAMLILAGFALAYTALFIEQGDLVLFLASFAAVICLAISALALRARIRRGARLLRILSPALLQESPAVAAVPAGAAPAPDARSGSPKQETDAAAGTARPADDPSSCSGGETYWVEEPFSFVRIEKRENESLVYQVHEPPVTDIEKTVLQETYAHLRDIIVFDATEADTRNHLEPTAVSRIIREFDPDITADRLAILTYYLKRDLSGYGPLEVLMRDPALEDISCNGRDLPVFVYHKAHGSLPTTVIFREGELNQFVLKLAQKANKQISLSNPLTDATLPDGARIQITYSDVVSLKGSSFTIRKFRAEPMTPVDLIRLGTYSPVTLAFLWLAIEHRKSLLIVGGTASGKTSTMNAVSLFIPQNAKIVSLEDTHEIQLPHRNWLPTQTRELSTESVKGDIDLFSLLKASMRQRPEFIIVGEVRGREAQTLFQAMNTGHATLSTIHAGSVNEAINRLTHDPINVPPVMFQALDLVIVQSIYTYGKRRIRRNTSIHEIEVDSHGAIRPVPLFEWNSRTDSFQQVYARSRLLEEIAIHRGWSPDDLARELKQREEFFGRAMETEHPDVRMLANAIHDLGD